MQQLAGYAEQDDIYPVFRKALDSDEKNLQLKALEQLSYIAATNKNAVAIDIIINFCENQPPSAFGDYAGHLVRIDDERVRSLLLKSLETQRGEDTGWRRNIARSMGMSGNSWVLDPLVDMIIEDGSSNAAAVITHIEDSESAVPRLLDALLKQQDHLKRGAIARAIRATGSKDLSERLTQALAESPDQRGTTFKGGIRFDVLQLMESFPDHQSLIRREGAVVRWNRYQQIEFNKSERSLKLTTPKSRSALMTSDGIKAGMQQPYAAGRIERLILGEYMTISLHLNYGGASYLFKRQGKKWKPIGYIGGVIS